MAWWLSRTMASAAANRARPCGRTDSSARSWRFTARIPDVCDVDWSQPARDFALHLPNRQSAFVFYPWRLVDHRRLSAGGSTSQLATTDVVPPVSGHCPGGNTNTARRRRCATADAAYRRPPGGATEIWPQWLRLHNSGTTRLTALLVSVSFLQSALRRGTLRIELWNRGAPRPTLGRQWCRIVFDDGRWTRTGNDVATGQQALR